MSEKQLDQSSSYDLGPEPADCDMVMKGGIASAVVYPGAACRLAVNYRLRRLGGTSAGAIAATFAAAAERGRGAGPDGGFVALNAIPQEIGGSLAKMFQASAGGRPAFSLLLAWVDPGRTTVGFVGRVLRSLVHPVSLLCGLVAALMVAAVGTGYAMAVSGTGAVEGLLAWLPVVAVAGVLATVVVGAVRLARGTLRALDANGFGLCDGHTRDPAVDHPPLTDWMADTLDRIAAIPPSPARPAGTPMSFGDLWGEAASAAYRAAMPDIRKGEASALSLVERRALAKARDTDVVVLTTNLSHGRPYRFPFSLQVFYWCPACFAGYFPGRVVDHLRATGAQTTPNDDPDDGNRKVELLCPRHPGVRLWYLPLAVDLPVVMAARLSLSFPGLLSAVPLHTVDFATTEGHVKVKTAWFSDGGIASNFPIHFFDQLLPTRPTFGINLTDVHPDSPDLVWRPRDDRASGLLPPHRTIRSTFGFVGALVDTLQNWVDNMQITTPGFNKRVANVRQREDEGGLNLKMPPQTITDLSDRGKAAAALFDTFDFDRHREVRYRIAMAGLDEVFDAMQEPYPTYRPLLEREVTAKLLRTSDGLVELTATWGEIGHPAQVDAPKPQPELRLLPRQ